MYGDSRHSSKHNKEFGSYCNVKDIRKNWNITQQAHDCCQSQTIGKTTKAVVKFANRENAELVLKSKKS